MKLTLIVADGVHTGKAIPITIPQFVIGRDPGCQLRPASSAISKQHCVFFVKADKAVLRDLKSTNGTFVNGERLDGEVELKDGDNIKAGPLVFTAKVEKPKPAAVDRPTPVPPTIPKKKAQTEDDDIAAMLLEVGDEIPATSLDADGIPTGTTMFEMPGYVPPPETSGPAAPKTPKKPASAQDNSSIAANVLEMYRRKRR